MPTWYIILGLFLLILSFHILTLLDEKYRLFEANSEMLVFYTILFFRRCAIIFGAMVIFSYPDLYAPGPFGISFVLFTPLLVSVLLTSLSEMLKNRWLSCPAWGSCYLIWLLHTYNPLWFAGWFN